MNAPGNSTDDLDLDDKPNDEPKDDNKPDDKPNDEPKDDNKPDDKPNDEPKDDNKPDDKPKDEPNNGNKPDDKPKDEPNDGNKPDDPRAAEAKVAPSKAYRGRLYKVLTGVGLAGAIAAGFLLTRDQQADPAATEEKGEKSSDVAGSVTNTLHSTESEGLIGGTVAKVKAVLSENVGGAVTKVQAVLAENKTVEAPKTGETNGDSELKDSEVQKEAVEASKTPSEMKPEEVEGAVVSVVKATTAEGAELVGVIVTAAPVADTTTSNDSKTETVIYGTPRRPDGDLSKAPLRDENGDIIIDCPTGAEKDKTDPFGIRCKTTGSTEEKK